DAQNLTRSSRIGKLTDSVDLTPVSGNGQDESGELTVSTVDIAVFELESEHGRDFSNTVPVSAKRNIQLKSVGGNDDILASALDQKVVHKIGRTTGHQKGYIREFMMLEKPFTLPNRRLYVYSDLFSVTSASKQKFSDHGDSGAPVYLSNGVLLGFVVGSMGGETVCCRAEDAINTMRMELFT
ncbi:MAG: hypothetical protein MI861_17460, partial [Pirellulales bacterium]|nr:hypothetical protein [Pirellulales bacterium]